MILKKEKENLYIKIKVNLMVNGKIYNLYNNKSKKKNQKIKKKQYMI